MSKSVRLGADVAGVFAELASLIETGVEPAAAAELAVLDQPSRRSRRVMSGIAKEMRSGKPLSGAVEDLPSFVAELLRRSESDGDVGRGLEGLSDYLEAAYLPETQAGAKLRRLFIYPGLVLGFLLMILLVLSVFVLPQFKELFEGFGAELPALTMIVLQIGTFMSDHLIWVLLLLFLLIVLWLIPAVRRAGPVRSLCGWISANMPLSGRLYRMKETVLCLRTLIFLNRSGFSLADGVAGAAEVTEDPAFSRALRESSEALQDGQSLSEALSRQSPLPERLGRIAALGGGTEKVMERLDRTADVYTEHIRRSLDRSLAAVNILLLIIVGLTVGAFLYAIYLPIFMLAGTV